MDRIVYLIMEQTMTQGMAHFHLRKAGADPEIFYVRIPHIYSRMRSDWPEELWSFLRPFVVAGESLDVGTVYDQPVDGGKNTGPFLLSRGIGRKGMGSTCSKAHGRSMRQEYGI